LGAEDLWEKTIYCHNKFNKDLSELKELNIVINQIIWLYDYLVEGEEEENYKKEVEDYIENKDDQVKHNNPRDNNEIILNNSSNINDN
jgi:thioredoxin-related protein